MYFCVFYKLKNTLFLFEAAVLSDISHKADIIINCNTSF